eukprot:scaffold247799_cov17-Tisochrysis_lutea.AAC.1
MIGAKAGQGLTNDISCTQCHCQWAFLFSLVGVGGAFSLLFWSDAGHLVCVVQKYGAYTIPKLVLNFKETETCGFNSEAVALFCLDGVVQQAKQPFK